MAGGRYIKSIEKRTNSNCGETSQSVDAELCVETSISSFYVHLNVSEVKLGRNHSWLYVVLQGKTCIKNLYLDKFFTKNSNRYAIYNIVYLRQC